MNTQVMVVTSAKGEQRRRPKILLAGFWLEQIGFMPNMLVTADYDKGSIVFKLQGEGLETYSHLIGQVRINRSGLLQIRHTLHNKKRVPHLEVKGFWLENLGFHIGDVIVVQSEYGLVKIKLLDRDKLGF